jgi:hypothetical protein
MRSGCQETLPTVFEDTANPPNSPSLWLEDTTISTPAKETEIFLHPNALEEDNSDSDMSEGEEEENDEDEDDSDDEWSCQDDNLEAVVLEALGGDLKLAAHLIPALHKSIYAESMANITQKVGPWRSGLIKSCSGADETNSSKTTSSNEQSNGSKSNPRKRQKRPGSVNQSREVDDEEDDDDDDDKDGKNSRENPASGSAAPLPRLACPFHKLNPAKYGIQHSESQNAKKTDYRSCAGPGFKNIQRLKYIILF